jgi:hypothetical protein
MIIFGGGLNNTSPCRNDVWVLSGANTESGSPEWTQLSPSGTPPSPRYAPAVYDPTSNTMIVFGGNNCFSTFYNEVWTLSNANGLGGTPAWTMLSPSGTAPSPRNLSTAAYDPASNTMIVFGGNNGASNFDEVWTLSNANGLGGTPAWTKLSPSGGLPMERSYHSAVYNPVLNRLTVFGGATGSTFAYANDVWVLSNANGLGGPPSWAQPSPSGAPPPARAVHSAVLDGASGRMIVFGGADSTGLLGDIWTLGPP